MTRWHYYWWAVSPNSKCSLPSILPRPLNRSAYSARTCSSVRLLMLSLMILGVSWSDRRMFWCWTTRSFIFCAVLAPSRGANPSSTTTNSAAYVTLFGKSRLNENSVEAFFRCNAFSTHCKCVEEHFQCVLKHCECVSTEAKCIAYPFKKHFQNVFNALANTDNAFNKTAAGCLESFMELVLLLLDTTKSLL